MLSGASFDFDILSDVPLQRMNKELKECSGQYSVFI